MENLSIQLQEIRLLAKAEELEAQAKRLLIEAKKYRAEASLLFCNLPTNENCGQKIEVMTL